MKNKKIISPSILSADFSRLGEELCLVERAGADSIHVDVMDGRFVPNITVGPLIVESVCGSTSLPVDVHLMIESPEDHIDNFLKLGIDSISIHQEACRHLCRTLQTIKMSGIKGGIAINPGTSLDHIKWVLEYVDFVLIMGVDPGFGGQKFIVGILNKILELHNMIENMKLSILIQVDGGINNTNISRISKFGANIFVAGSAIFNENDYFSSISKLRSNL